MEQGKSSSKVQGDVDLEEAIQNSIKPSVRTGEVNNDIANSMIIKSCTIRRIIGKITSYLKNKLPKLFINYYYLN